MCFRKIFTLLFTVCCLIATLWAQDSRYELKDSENVREKDRMRQWSYENNLTSYSPKKRNNWSLGFKGGHSFVSGDVAPLPGWTAGINLRKGLGHVFSIRIDGNAGQAGGLDWRRNGAIESNPTWNGTSTGVDYSTEPGYVFRNFKTSFFDLGVQGVVSFNNINFYRKVPKANVYGFAGIGAMAYKTMVDAVDASGAKYGFDQIGEASKFSHQFPVRKDLRELMDGTYETLAERQNFRPSLDIFTFNPTMMVGGGISFKISRRVDLSLEHSVMFAFDDLIDGHRWKEVTTQINMPSTALDVIHKTTFGINFRIGKGEDALWWSNPLDKPLNRIRSVDHDIAKYTTDTDGDGVVDALDKDNKTPQGVVVDNHGLPQDSDGDGVFDYEDDELFSPKRAQVDSRGVAIDSDSDGVPDIFDLEPRSPSGSSVDAKGKAIVAPTVATGGQAPAVSNAPLGGVNFDLNSAVIKTEFLPNLVAVSRFLQENPGTRIKVEGHADTRNSTKKNDELSKNRAQAVVNFLVKNLKVDPARLEMSFKGDQEPLIKDVPAGSEDLHYLNRRVEFKAIK